MPFTEDTFEQAVLEIFQNLGYTVLYGPELERDYTSPLLESVLRDSLVKLNKGLPIEAIQEAMSKLKNFESGSQLQKNMTFMDYLQNGITVRYYVKGEVVFTCGAQQAQISTPSISTRRIAPSISFLLR